MQQVPPRAQPLESFATSYQPPDIQRRLEADLMGLDAHPGWLLVQRFLRHREKLMMEATRTLYPKESSEQWLTLALGQIQGELRLLGTLAGKDAFKTIAKELKGSLE